MPVRAETNQMILRTDGTPITEPLRKEISIKIPGVEVFCPPFIEHHLSILRDQNTQQAQFRASTDAIFKNVWRTSC